jgi:hypothetical protein
LSGDEHADGFWDLGGEGETFILMRAFFVHVFKKSLSKVCEGKELEAVFGGNREFFLHLCPAVPLTP